MNHYLANVQDAVRIGLGTILRITPGPVLVRVVVFVVGFAAPVVALPGDLRVPAAFVVAALAAAVPAVSPGTWTVTVLEAAAIGLWVLRTSAYDEPVTVLSLGGLAAALYVHHSASALAAALPLDAVVARSVVGRWSVRVLAVVAGTVALGAVAVSLEDRLGSARTVALPVLGIGLAIVVAGALAYSFRRERHD